MSVARRSAELMQDDATPRRPRDPVERLVLIDLRTMLCPTCERAAATASNGRTQFVGRGGEEKRQRTEERRARPDSAAGKACYCARSLRTRSAVSGWVDR